MRIIDNRHLDFSELVQIGDLVLTENNKHYIFIYENDEENLPMHQIDIDTFESVDCYPKHKFNEFKVGSLLEIGGRIKEIIKNKNLILDIRK